MEQEVDLRPYIERLISLWWLPLLLAIAAAAAVFFYGRLQPKAYDASAMIVISEPSQRVILDPGFVPTDRIDELLKAYPSIAMSSDVLNLVLAHVQDKPETQISTLSQLERHLDVSSTADSRLLQLHVSLPDGNLAAEVANLWAAEFVHVTNRVYGNQGARVEFYQEQLEQAKANAAAAEDAFTEFQGRNRFTLETNLVSALSQQQLDLLAKQQQTELDLQEVRQFQQQLAAGSGEVTYADQVTAMQIQLRVYGGLATQMPPQLQLSAGEPLTETDRKALINQLEALAGALEGKLAQIDTDLADLEPRYLKAQQDMQVNLAELTRLMSARDVANETVNSVARRLDTEIVASGEENQTVRLASTAVAPDAPRGGNMGLVAVAGLLGLLLGILLILLSTWWQQYRRPGLAPADQH